MINKIKRVEDIRTLKDLIPKPFNFRYDTIKQFFSNNFNNLVSRITDNEEDNFFISYYSKSMSKKLSNFINLLIINYSVLFNYGFVVDSNNNLIVDNNGNKIVIKSNTHILPIDVIKNICQLIERRYYTKWDKLYNSIHLQYNPLKPFSLDSDETIDTDNTTHGVSNSTIHNAGKNTTGNTVDNNEQYSFGYQSGDNGTKISDNKGYNESEENVDMSRTDNNDSTTTNNGNITRKTERSGNIGNISLQDLLIKERNVVTFQLYPIMYTDIDSILVRATYG